MEQKSFTGMQDLLKMTPEELQDLIEKDFNSLWFDVVNNENLIVDERTTERRNNDRIVSMAKDNFQVYKKDKFIIIKISTMCEKLTFDCQSSFKQTIEQFPKTTKYIIDFSNVNLISVAAVKMLLYLFHHNGMNEGYIKLINCNSSVGKIFKTAKLDHVFEIT